MTAAAVSASVELADHTCATCGHRWTGPVGSPECASAACLAHVQRIARAVGGADEASPEVRILAQIALHQHAELERLRALPAWETCSRCAAPLLFSARQRGDGLCGPCSRAAQEPPSPGLDLGPLQLVADTAVAHVVEYTTPEQAAERWQAAEPVIARDLPGLLADVRRLRVAVADPRPAAAPFPQPEPGLVGSLVSALQRLVASVERTGGYASPDEQATLWAARDALQRAAALRGDR